MFMEGLSLKTKVPSTFGYLNREEPDSLVESPECRKIEDREEEKDDRCKRRRYEMVG